MILHQRQYIVPPRDTEQSLDTFLVVSWEVSVKSKDALNLLPWPGETTPQTKIWPRMSFLQRLRSPVLETQVLVVCAAACSLFSQCCNTRQFCQENTEHPFATCLKVYIPVNVTFFSVFLQADRCERTLLLFA